jgi:hypothetical protein
MAISDQDEEEPLHNFADPDASWPEQAKAFTRNVDH